MKHPVIVGNVPQVDIHLSRLAQQVPDECCAGRNVDAVNALAAQIVAQFHASQNLRKGGGALVRRGGDANKFVCGRRRVFPDIFIVIVRRRATIVILGAQFLPIKLGIGWAVWQICNERPFGKHLAVCVSVTI